MSGKLPTRLLAPAVAILCCLTPLSAWSGADSAAGINMKNRFMTQRNSSWVEFTLEALGIATSKGYFTTFGSTIFYDQENIENSSLTFYVKTDSLSMANGLLDQAFQSPALLDAANHPRIVFQSRRIVPRSGGGFDMMGNLTVKGVTKEVTCRMEAPTSIVRDDQSNLDMVGFRGSMAVDRRDFGLAGIPQLDALFQGKPRVSNDVQVRFSFGAFRYTLDYLEARFHGKAQDGSLHPVGVLYDLTRQKGGQAALNEFD
ncbi:MAG: YceI family protein, partial [Acidobacteriota bacterium]